MFLLIDHSFYDAAEAFRTAVECPDSNSDRCYQLHPGVIQEVRRIDKTSEGQQAKIDIASQGFIVEVTLLPSDSEVPLLQAGTPVRVERYHGNVASVLIGDRIIPSTQNLANSHPNFAFVGGILIWLAAAFAAITIVNRRATAALARIQLLPSEERVRALVASPSVLPGGSVGWVLRPRLNEIVVLPLALALWGLVSARPFMNPDHGLAVLIYEALLIGAFGVRFGLTFLNSRFMVDRSGVAVRSWLGQTKSWPLDAINEVLLISVRWRSPGWWVPALLFVGRDRSDLLVRTSLFWSLDAIGAACVTAGLSVRLADIEFTRPARLNLGYRVIGGLAAMADLVILAVSFLPPPPANLPIPPAGH